jgi:hypothetical protein
MEQSLFLSQSILQSNLEIVIFNSWCMRSLPPVVLGQCEKFRFHRIRKKTNNQANYKIFDVAINYFDDRDNEFFKR